MVAALTAGGACGRSIGGSEPRSCADGICGSTVDGGACGKSIGGSEPRSCAAGTCGLVAESMAGAVSVGGGVPVGTDGAASAA